MGHLGTAERELDGQGHSQPSTYDEYKAILHSLCPPNSIALAVPAVVGGMELVDKGLPDERVKGGGRCCVRAGPEREPAHSDN
jgi:hypothetical protein